MKDCINIHLFYASYTDKSIVVIIIVYWITHAFREFKGIQILLRQLLNQLQAGSV